MIIRFLVAFISAAVFMIATYYLAPDVFAIFLLLILMIAAFEMSKLLSFQSSKKRILMVASIIFFSVSAWFFKIEMVFVHLGLGFWIFAFYPLGYYPRKIAWYQNPGARYALGFLMLVPAFSALIFLHRKFGAEMVLLLAFTVWAVDSGGYGFGKMLGRHKLAPKLSGAKTIEGALGGIVLGFATFWIFAVLFSIPTKIGIHNLVFAVLGLVVIFAAIIGDLFESMIKRLAGKKDSGAILPGHGGILDRIDGLCAAAPVFAAGVYW